MTDPHPSHGATLSATTPDLRLFIQALGGLLGAVLLITGLVYTVHFLSFFFGLLTAPEKFQTYHEQMVQALGTDSLDLQIGEQTYKLTQVVALFAFGFGLMIMGRLLTLLMSTGAAILRNCLPERKKAEPGLPVNLDCQNL